ncbi:MAG: universal stress protein [Roseimicrobium sp.]
MPAQSPGGCAARARGRAAGLRACHGCADLSETSAKAVRAARLVAEQDKAALDCLFVYQSALALSLDYGGFVPPLPMLDVDSSLRWKNELGEFLAPLLRTATDLNWQSVVMERVNIREAIIEHIRESKTDLVVLGTRGKTDLRSLLLGTTAEKVVTHAPCSILAVKPDDFVYPLEDKTTLPPATAPLA